jgi:hypothetical protein
MSGSGHEQPPDNMAVAAGSPQEADPLSGGLGGRDGP